MLREKDNIYAFLGQKFLRKPLNKIYKFNATAKWIFAPTYKSVFLVQSVMRLVILEQKADYNISMEKLKKAKHYATMWPRLRLRDQRLSVD